MTPLLDRQRELDLISEALEAAEGASGSLLVVTGGLGTGKTTLLRALRPLAEQRGTQVLSASAALLEQDFAFGVVGQLLEPLLPDASFEPAADAPEPARGPAPAAAPEPHGELLALAADRASRTPLLLLVDDLQWADAPSLRWLGHLAKRIAHLRITAVVALREGDPRGEEPRVHEITDRAARVLRPDPLSPQSTAELVAARFGRPADPAYLTACHEIGAGNPLFLTAALDALAGTGAPDAERAHTVRTTPLPSLRERFLAALRTQPAPVQAMAKALAVLDGHTDLELAGRLAGLDGTGRDAAIRSLRRLGLLTPADGPRFVHRAVREAVEDAMTSAEHEDSHIYAALLLHGAGHPAEQAAAQLLEATSCQDGWAIEVLRSAATAAMRRGAPEDAARYLRRALLGSTPAGPDRAALLVDLATVERAFDPPAAIRHISQALLLIPTATQRAKAAARIPPSQLGGCPPPSVDVVCKVAGELGDATLIAGEDRELALRLEARLRHIAVAGPGRLLTCADRLRALGPTPPLGTAAERELVTVLLHGATMTQSMSAAEVGPLANRVLQYEPATPDHVYSALPLLPHILIAADSVEIIGPWLRTAQDRARRENAVVPQGVIGIELTQVLLAQGRLEEARAQAAEALALGVTGWATLQSMIGIVLVAIESRDAELTRRLLEYRREGASHGHQPSSLQLLRGSMAAAVGDLPTALEYFLDWGRAAERADWRNPAVFPWRAWAAGLHYRMGHAAQAQELMEEEWARARAWGTPVAIGRALRMRGAVTEGERGLELLRESLDVLEGSVNGMERARTSVLLGRRLRAAGRADAETQLRRGREQALASGVPWLADRAARELQAMARRASPLDVEALTRTERRVAGLAAHGVSNRDIAERLDVSSRAVEKHLTHAYRKLNVSGRAELAGLAHLLPDGTADAPRTAVRRTAANRTEPKHRGTPG
ncbi:AAA family ATPase [Streptomyces albireticuli]|uniref:AAA family ATPase n=1 Tax=Streptomyces albireticuli TaxID=1940 RepID=UPI0036B4BC6B